MNIKKQNGKLFGIVSLPVYTSTEFIFELPDNYKDLTPLELWDLVQQNMECLGTLCYQCSTHTESDFEINSDYVKENLADLFTKF